MIKMMMMRKASIMMKKKSEIMKKTSKKFLKPAAALSAALSLMLPMCAGAASAETAPASSQPAKKDLRGVWVATVLNIDYPSKATTDAEILKNEALKILDAAKNAGLNAVFLQVRPTADAFYKSKYFPWSKYLTGKQGLAPDGGFDPLAFWVEEAHKRGMELHAWLNPYRITKKGAGEPNWDTASLDPKNPARLHPGWVVKHTDGNLYFNPGIPEVRQFIIKGALEIVGKYDVDGIHFDDYFYPGKDFNDSETFKKYGAGYSNIDDWRRANVNALISGMHSALKASGKNVRFGVSPFGIWANKKNNPLGSDTNGLESYYSHYADTRKWVKEGMLDYIAPQIYWNIGYAAADYAKLLAWWKDVVRGTTADLYIGHAAYKAGDSSPSSPWYGISEIERQLKLNETVPEVKGSIFFSLRSLAGNPALAAMLKPIFDARDGVKARTQVSCSRPSENIRTSYDKFYLNGASDPSKPLYLNGVQVEKRSKRGYFGILVPLSEGPNIFTFSQEGSYATRVIFREIPSTAASGSGTSPKTETVPEDSLLYARVAKPVVDTYDSPSTGNGAAYELYEGMTDLVAATCGDYVRLSSGQWVKKSGVEIFRAESQIRPEIANASYETGEKWEMLKLEITQPASAIASFSGTSVKLTVSPAFLSPKLPSLPADSLFSSIKAARKSGCIEYTLTLKDNAAIHGYYVEKTSTGITLHIKRPIKAAGGDKPLSGITVMLDAGHGGSENGAIGPLGTRYAEKAINLKTALRLRTELLKLGANVLMIRTTDKAVSLADRLAASRNAKPDIFISLHANSMPDNVDISAVEGFSTYYRGALGKKLAEIMLAGATADLKRKNMGSHNKNFYVLRGTWTPSVLIETGFVPNPAEFEWLVGTSSQAAIAKSIAKAILEYFK